MKEFNTTGVCIPAKHYMVDLSERVKEIKELVDDGKYFTINRARQYGKTTTLWALSLALESQYDVVSIDFQDITDADFENENEFTKGLSQLLCDTRDSMEIPISDKYYGLFQELAGRNEKVKLNDIFRIFDKWCKENPKQIILIIDEVDTATNNQVFLDFLGKLRSNYLKRERNTKYKTFQSVILAGVTDVKHLRSKIRPDDAHKVNSPWNIATDFDIDMSLSEEGIKGMLDEYEADHHTGMDTAAIAKSIREYTNGYPYLVSRICQLIDGPVSRTISISDEQPDKESKESVSQASCNSEKQPATYIDGTISQANGHPDIHKNKELNEITGKVYRRSKAHSDKETNEVTICDRKLSAAWTDRGIDEAVKLILSESNTLFQSLTKNLENYPELKAAIRSLLMQGERMAWNPDQEDIQQLQMYGLVKNDNNTVKIANRIFETRLYNLFLSEEEIRSNVFSREGDRAKNIFITDGRLNMRLIMEHFIETYIQVCGPLGDRFNEKDGRELFLLYLRPIINGTGNYYIEAQTRDQKRTDVIIDYLGQQYIIELKIWRGPRYNEDGEKQIREYLDYFGLSTGYMLSFNFNKKKEVGVRPVHIGDKLLYEGVL